MSTSPALRPTKEILVIYVHSTDTTVMYTDPDTDESEEFTISSDHSSYFECVSIKDFYVDEKMPAEESAKHDTQEPLKINDLSKIKITMNYRSTTEKYFNEFGENITFRYEHYLKVVRAFVYSDKLNFETFDDYIDNIRETNDDIPGEILHVNEYCDTEFYSD